MMRKATAFKQCDSGGLGGSRGRTRLSIFTGGIPKEGGVANFLGYTEGEGIVGGDGCMTVLLFREGVLPLPLPVAPWRAVAATQVSCGLQFLLCSMPNFAITTLLRGTCVGFFNLMIEGLGFSAFRRVVGCNRV